MTLTQWLLTGLFWAVAACALGVLMWTGFTLTKPIPEEDEEIDESVL